ncbi:putative membrane protein [Glaesserella parasuis 12939]|nr:putative membrane protein [Glaesserella parasuis MN-H]EPZ99923.1 putative membrane protein [Glaesserella parasuis str. Nagasaki]EQA00165.1 putative membrane protein [Glaesserella parasuis SW114]EQA04872.1 putative membrane protein [Glaesserella parasuis 12939]EQA06700.1 putative membrane protein [Glaesserella parasuis D74]EQA13601.1 putative membrane protein [Glaesserella parasuis SW140]
MFGEISRLALIFLVFIARIATLFYDPRLAYSQFLIFR